MSAVAIRHRVARGRLFVVYPGVYAVGTPELDRDGQWTAAVMACCPGALLSHGSAGCLWRVLPASSEPIEFTVAARRNPRAKGISIHRTTRLDARDCAEQNDIPVTSIVRTFIDLAAILERDELEAAIREADRLDLIDPERLRLELADRPPQPGIGGLRETLDRRTFRLTDSQLERRFLPLSRRAGLGIPLTQQMVNGYRVDFYWPELGLVVETDGLRYHRTPAQQTHDRVRDQAHTAAGLTPLRFTHEQIRYRPEAVERTLTRTARMLSRKRLNAS